MLRLTSSGIPGSLTNANNSRLSLCCRRYKTKLHITKNITVIAQLITIASSAPGSSNLTLGHQPDSELSMWSLMLTSAAKPTASRTKSLNFSARKERGTAARLRVSRTSDTAYQPFGPLGIGKTPYSQAKCTKSEATRFSARTRYAPPASTATKQTNRLTTLKPPAKSPTNTRAALPISVRIFHSYVQNSTIASSRSKKTRRTFSFSMGCSSEGAYTYSSNNSSSASGAACGCAVLAVCKVGHRRVPRASPGAALLRCLQGCGF